MAELVSRHLSWSNALTVSRLLSAPCLFFAILGGSIGLSCGLFWFAVATDVADGRLARARGEVTAFGGLLDHATDASFVCSGLAALVMTGVVPAALPLLVLLAFAQYVLDSESLAGRKLRASFLGRWNGVFYFVPIGVVVTRDALGLSWPADSLVRGLGFVLVLSTIASMADRLWTLMSVRRSDSGSL
ncbi:MAG: CDP-alcohol phosphatidyltransferase family protein [bacterium]|nr:CDP-alcohol phosphatidyltransferase family protein [bacterium]